VTAERAPSRSTTKGRRERTGFGLCRWWMASSRNRGGALRINTARRPARRVDWAAVSQAETVIERGRGRPPICVEPEPLLPGLVVDDDPIVLGRTRDAGGFGHVRTERRVGRRAR